MRLWPFRLTFHPGRQRPTIDQLTILALGIPALVLPFFLRPSPTLLGTHTQLFLPPCSFYRLTTVPCVTCGMTTSFAFFTHHQFASAVLAHPLGILIYLYLLLLVLILGGATVLGRAVSVTWRASILQVIMALGLGWAAKLMVWYLLT